MRIHLLLLLLVSIPFNFIKGQQNSDFAVELAAFDQSVPLSYFKGISGVYETLDINQIYRYHIATSNKEEAETILQKVKQSGFPAARIIDFGYIKSVCEAQCGYIPPKPTGIGMRDAQPPTNKGGINNNITTPPNTNPTNTTASANNSNKRNIGIDAASILGKNAVALPEEFDDADWLAFFSRNMYLGLTEAELLEIYKKNGNIHIDHATWFSFKKKNTDLEATDAELMELYIRHGNIKIEQATWFSFKKEKGDGDVDWLDFKEKNADLEATDAELKMLYTKHGNIRISQAIWFHFKNNPQAYPSEKPQENGTITTTADVQTIGFVMFEFGGIKLSNITTPELDKVAAALVKNKNLRIELIGHADAVGNAANNHALSLRRAATISQYLTQKGVVGNRIKISAKGEDNPIAINNNMDGSDCPEGRKYNRRVDLKVLDPDGNEVQIVSSIKIPDHLLMR